MPDFIDELKATIEAAVRELSAEIVSKGDDQEKNGRINAYTHVLNLIGNADKADVVDLPCSVHGLTAHRLVVATGFAPYRECIACGPDTIDLSVQFRTGGHRGATFPRAERERVNNQILDAFASGGTIEISGVQVPARDIQYWQWEDEERPHHG